MDALPLSHLQQRLVTEIHSEKRGVLRMSEHQKTVVLPSIYSSSLELSVSNPGKKRSKFANQVSAAEFVIETLRNAPTPLASENTLNYNSPTMVGCAGSKPSIISWSRTEWPLSLLENATSTTSTSPSRTHRLRKGSTYICRRKHGRLFCIKFANECLHHFIQHRLFEFHVFKYKSEGIALVPSISYFDNSECICLLQTSPVDLSTPWMSQPVAHTKTDRTMVEAFGKR